MGATAEAKDSRTAGSRRDRTAEAIALSAVERRQRARLLAVFVLIAVFFVVELVAAKIARSDVLEADAYHLLMDVLALAISLGALRLAIRRPSARFTFGLRRAEPMAAIANGALVLGVAVELVRDAIGHLEHPATPRSEVMLVVASAALMVNGFNAWLLHGVLGRHGHHHHHHGHAHHDDHEHAHDSDGAHGHDGEGGGGDGRPVGALNIRGAWLHLLGDALGSLAAFIAGLAIRLGAPSIVDPIASFVVVAILVVGALRLLRDAGLVLLEAAPVHLPVAKVEKVLLAVPGVSRVSAVHVWSLGTGHDAVTAHVRASTNDPTLAKRASEAVRDELNVEYVTIQVEPD